jgi:hypothetical protein
MKNRITINGVTIETDGSSIHVTSNGNVSVGGVVVMGGLSGTINVQFEGDLASLTCQGSATVNGSVQRDVDAGGSITVGGNVGGDVDAGGSITVAGNVSGDADAGGSIRCGSMGRR